MNYNLSHSSSLMCWLSFALSKGLIFRIQLLKMLPSVHAMRHSVNIDILTELKLILIERKKALE